MTFVADGERVARKPHVCGLCLGRIEIRELHYWQTTVDAGRIGTWRAHRECWGALPAYERWFDIDASWMGELEVDPDEFREFVAERPDRTEVDA